MGSINSIVANANLVKKVYFPREVLPIASVLAELINFLLAFLLLFAALIVFRAQFSPWLWTLPFVILIQTCFTIGMAFFLSTLNVFYRDTMMIMNVVMLAWFFLTPVFYAINILPGSYVLWVVSLNPQRLAYILNPIASLINIYRDLLYWGYRTDLDFFVRTTVTALIFLVAGYWFFIRYSDRFGEEL
jgi:ABC-type polysaccharide/polyol phosphate export permease